MPTVAQRVPALESLIASIISGASRISKVRVKPAVKLPKGNTGKRQAIARSTVERAPSKGHSTALVR